MYRPSFTAVTLITAAILAGAGMHAVAAESSQAIAGSLGESR